MTNESRPQFLDFVPDFPKRPSLRKSLSEWMREMWHFFLHTVRPTARFLPKPKRELEINTDNLRIEAGDGEAYAGVIRRLVASGEERLNTVRSKGNNLLGFVTLVSPVFAWWLLSGRDRLSNAPIATLCSNSIGAIAAVFLCLAVRALLRTQAVVGFDGPSIDMAISVEPGTLKPYDLVEEVRRLVLRWGQLQRWSDVIADHFRAGQRFLVIALVLSIVAGAICYFHEDPPKSVVIVPNPNPPAQPAPSQPFIVIVGAALVVVAMTVALALQLYIACRFWGCRYVGRGTDDSAPETSSAKESTDGTEGESSGGCDP